MYEWEKLNEVGKSKSATFIPTSKQPSHVLNQTLDQKQTIVFIGKREEEDKHKRITNTKKNKMEER
jgi:hypothetical protein